VSKAFEKLPWGIRQYKKAKALRKITASANNDAAADSHMTILEWLLGSIGDIKEIIKYYPELTEVIFFRLSSQLLLEANLILGFVSTEGCFTVELKSMVQLVHTLQPGFTQKKCLALLIQDRILPQEIFAITPENIRNFHQCRKNKLRTCLLLALLKGGYTSLDDQTRDTLLYELLSDPQFRISLGILIKNYMCLPDYISTILYSKEDLKIDTSITVYHPDPIHLNAAFNCALRISLLLEAFRGKYTASNDLKKLCLLYA
jgi:hypothetical protein